MDAIDCRLIEAVQKGLPLSSRPYADIGKLLDLNEQEVIVRLDALKKQGLISRLGVIVNHRQLGYRANAMVVIDVPDALVDQIGGHISRFKFVNLCYRRPRQGEVWPYNLYCMIHGKSRERVLEQLQDLIEACGLGQFTMEVLFSKRCFKQRGAIYKPSSKQSFKLAHG
ncbi:siroheme decarboxylase subunit beta [Methylomarinum vadi]|uniref:siroheme decarboxylase subunit beta n=1 Tax=Methylomarinum vadi TaxID=438855 RepID=UPI000691A29D|nr:AsnC family transcriptional regulator [Methylomarinum vadi]